MKVLGWILFFLVVIPLLIFLSMFAIVAIGTIALHRAHDINDNDFEKDYATHANKNTER